MACTHASFTPGCRDCARDSSEPTALRPSDEVDAEPSTFRSRNGDAGEAPPLDPTLITSRLPRGALVGRYVVLDTVGQGGMGCVYSAFDPELDRKVAVKLLRPEANQSQDDGRSRLLREAQAMARLAHPNVVAVHDAGVYADSVFLAMEYVEGKTLQGWARAAPRTWRDALTLLIAAGRGLSAAHAAGLIHRDFKPANVLVGDDGRVCVTDFGLVRAVDAPPPQPKLPPRIGQSLRTSSPSLDSQLTEQGVVMGTPGYMAPEQLTDEPVTPATDQFAFCASAYQVLYGELPFGGKTLNEYSAAVVVGTVRPPPAGSKVPGWVRQILLRGLSVRPSDRFPSMDALLDALGRDPAVARRRWLAAGLAATVVLAGGAALALGNKSQGQLCSGAPLRLEGVWDAAAKANGEKAFTATGKPFAAMSWTQASRELDRYASAWTAMHRDACEATRVRGEQPESVLALRMGCLDERLRALGAVARTFGSANAKVVEKAIDAASALPRLDTCADVAALSQPVPPPADAAGRAKLEAAQQKLAEARALYQTGQFQKAMELVTPLTSLGDDVGFRATEATALFHKSQLMKTLGQPAEEAEATLLAAVAAAEAAKNDEVRSRAMAALVGVVGYDRGLPKEAHRLAKLAEGAIARGGGDELRRADLAKSLADVEWRSGAFEPAVRLYQEALELRRRRYTGDHPDVAYLLYSIGWTLMDMEALDRAAEPLGQALQMQERLYGEDHPKTLTMMNAVAVLAARRDDLTQAHALFARMIELHGRAYGTDHPNYAVGLQNFASVLVTEGKLEQALESARGAERIMEAKRKNSPDYAGSLAQVGHVLTVLKRYDEALELQQRALQMLEKDHPDTDLVSRVLAELSETLSGLGRHDEAISAAKRALAREDKPEAGASVAKWIQKLAQAYRAAGRDDDAVAAATRMLKVREDAKAHAASLAEARFELAQALWGKKKERSRALQLGTEARDAYVAAGRARLALAVDRWLEAHR